MAAVGMVGAGWTPAGVWARANMPERKPLPGARLMRGRPTRGWGLASEGAMRVVAGGWAARAGGAAAGRQADAGQADPGLGVDLGGDDADRAGGLADLVGGDRRRHAGAQGQQVGFRDFGVQLQAAVADDAEQLGAGRDDLALGDAA